MAEGLRALAAFTKSQGSVSRPTWHSKLSLTPVSDDLMPPSGLLENQTCAWYTYAYMYTYIHMK